MEREALKLAFEALTYIHAETSTEEDVLIDEAIVAIKAALAQPAQEPVACERCKQLEGQAYDLLGQLKVANLKWSVAHPWVGLTDEELADCLDMSIQKTCRAIEAKLKEKNT